MDEKQKKEYEQYVSRITPTHNLFLQMIKAFVTGGTICFDRPDHPERLRRNGP